MTPPIKLSGLTEREAVQDAIFRFVTSFDKADKTLLDSSFTNDAVFNLSGTELKGLEEITTKCFDGIAKLDTTHFITNVRLEIDRTGISADATASALAQHYREGTGKDPHASRCLAGSLYDMKLIKDPQDGLWKIERVDLKVVWLEGEPAILQGK